MRKKEENKRQFENAINVEQDNHLKSTSLSLSQWTKPNETFFSNTSISDLRHLLLRHHLRRSRPHSIPKNLKPDHKLPPDHPNLEKHICLVDMMKIWVYDWVGRLQSDLWRPGDKLSLIVSSRPVRF
ncbi:hypothetical protein YC2023_118223 [Brassica napus]